MHYSYYAHPRFAAFRERLGYETLAPGIYLAPYKHQGLVDAPLLFRRLVRSLLPTLFIEKDLSEKEAGALLKRDIFCMQGISYQKPPVPNAIERGTFVIGLEQSEQELWDSFDYSLRKQLQKEAARDLRVEQVLTENDLRGYYGLLRAFRDREGFRTPSWKKFLLQWQMLRGDVGIYEAFIVRDTSDTLLAGIGLVSNPETGGCIEVAAVRAETGLPVMDILRWSVIRWARSRGMRRYDLAGADPHAIPGTKDEGIFRYKRKWGGDMAVVYHYETYFPRNRWYYPLAHRLLQWTGFART